MDKPKKNSQKTVVPIRQTFGKPKKHLFEDSNKAVDSPQKTPKKFIRVPPLPSKLEQYDIQKQYERFLYLIETNILHFYYLKLIQKSSMVLKVISKLLWELSDRKLDNISVPKGTLDQIDLEKMEEILYNLLTLNIQKIMENGISKSICFGILACIYSSIKHWMKENGEAQYFRFIAEFISYDNKIADNIKNLIEKVEKEGDK